MRVATDRAPTRLVEAIGVMVAAALVATCADGTGDVEPRTSPTSAVSTATGTQIRIESDVPYIDDGKGGPISTDVYRPSLEGPWPVVVMLHGEPSDLSADRLWAESIAQAGALVFTPRWSGVSASRPDSIARHFADEIGRAACAVRWAREHAEGYGGDPSTVTVLGHCTGANVAAMAAFGEPEPAEGCLSGTGSTVPDALVLFEGDWLLEDPSWDGAFEENARVLDDFTPWRALRSVPFPVRLLVSELSLDQLRRDVADLWAEETWLADRDPGGHVRRLIERLGLFEDGSIGIGEENELFRYRLEALGVDASLHLLSGSGHTSLSEEGTRTLLNVTLD